MMMMMNIYNTDSLAYMG